jgi:hypothetical protein
MLGPTTMRRIDVIFSCYLRSDPMKLTIHVFLSDTQTILSLQETNLNSMHVAKLPMGC